MEIICIRGSIGCKVEQQPQDLALNPPEPLIFIELRGFPSEGLFG